MTRRVVFVALTARRGVGLLVGFSELPVFTVCGDEDSDGLIAGDALEIVTEPTEAEVA